ncbi:hypothetical protein MLD38_027002 [Melastoma candidum]|uniref:Uncharacterized protein n=1 Tax=Melastoma candidum TaxID=119954 RepID=A0ACB9P3H5_9MYRT|nr:hypothetical protein MLD38_027002 [Melastoma candidum]
MAYCTYGAVQLAAGCLCISNWSDAKLQTNRAVAHGWSTLVATGPRRVPNTDGALDFGSYSELESADRHSRSDIRPELRGSR